MIIFPLLTTAVALFTTVMVPHAGAKPPKVNNSNNVAIAAFLSTYVSSPPSKLAMPRRITSRVIWSGVLIS